MARDSNPNEWHGHQIITEDELASPEFSIDEKFKRNRKIRHGAILVLTVLILAIALVGAYLINTRAIVIDALEPKPVVEKPVAVDASCPVGELKYMEPAKMKVNVMNGTKIAGLAGATSTKLKKRGFAVGEVGNVNLSKTNIVGVVTSGTDGYAQAMTLQRQVKGLTYVFDPKRLGTSVDLVIGTEYKDLIEEKKVNKKPGKLECVPTEKPAPEKPAPEKPAPEKPEPEKPEPADASKKPKTTD
ncbi:hypothetical protein CQ018_15600 [Arthrobacter sp. MYb227]|uniref:LytR C-terminal domain-containing protein n=1 Tax=Arthrobacter sp. MYb227 TaxID=1848601 RepID=UPI000CFB7B46|nr:LytR C-terminal domain-containing protein [Arthrobacter sp. MYb227]PQZ89573.1 hypothetical protein CQ018_15600 [Arthrobacter sp. MYb227]